MSDLTTVEQANAGFYQAFETLDIAGTELLRFALGENPAGGAADLAIAGRRLRANNRLDVQDVLADSQTGRIDEDLAARRQMRSEALVRAHRHLPGNLPHQRIGRALFGVEPPARDHEVVRRSRGEQHARAKTQREQRRRPPPVADPRE